MFNSERLMRDCLQCSVRMTMANNNIFKPKITSATQTIRNDTTISFEINQDSAVSKLGTQSHKLVQVMHSTYYWIHPPSETKYLTFEMRYRRLLPLETSPNQLRTHYNSGGHLWGIPKGGYEASPKRGEPPKLANYRHYMISTSKIDIEHTTYLVITWPLPRRKPLPRLAYLRQVFWRNPRHHLPSNLGSNASPIQSYTSH